MSSYSSSRLFHCTHRLRSLHLKRWTIPVQLERNLVATFVFRTTTFAVPVGSVVVQPACIVLWEVTGNTVVAQQADDAPELEE